MRALIIEDEPGIADAVRRGLLAEGFAVDVALDGVDGLWKATSVDYDIVLLDVMLPGLSGQEVLRRMRAEEVWSPVLMLTAKDADDDIVAALDTG
ncbi:MAG: response regulator, partial [Marmoricola sp.]